MAFDTEKFQQITGDDLNLALKEIRLPLAVYERLLRISVESCDKAAAGLAAALSAGDLKAVEVAAHDFKGVYANLRVKFLADPAGELHDRAREGADPAVLRPVGEKVLGRYALLKEFLGGV